MNAKQPAPARQTNLLRLVLPALAAAIAVSSSNAFFRFDQGLSTFFAFRTTGNSANHWLVLPAVAISFLSFEAAIRVKSKFLIVVFLQLSALGILLAWLSAQLAGSASVLASLIASTLSFALGLMAREVKTAEEQQTSRYFELAIKNAELDQTRLALLKQDEADRRILASDLHDQVLNEIKQIKSKVIALTGSPAIEKDSIDSIEQSLDTAGRHIRDVMESLFPSVLENLGLCSALDQLTRDCCHKAGLQGRFLKTIDDKHLQNLTKTEELILFRLTQEAINNIVKHAQAKTVRVNLEGQEGRLVLCVIDDGSGFSVKERGESRGLRYMRLRADLIGATISWSDNLKEDQPTGTVVKIDLITEK